MFHSLFKRLTSITWNHSSVSLCLLHSFSSKLHPYVWYSGIKYLIIRNVHHSPISYASKTTDIPEYLYFRGSFTKDETLAILENMTVIESFLSIEEEKTLLNEIEPYMKRLRYESNHWDDAIHGYRETERSKWNEENTKIIDRVRNCAFPPGSPQLGHVHILDLLEEGYIKPHIDSVRFCGHTIAGLSLLTDSVMRLVHDKDKSKIVDIMLKRRSMYIMRNNARYDYTHEILSNKESQFKEKRVEKKRRISVICRNEPNKESE